MPQNANQPIGSQWEMITDANVSAVTFQVTGEFAVHIAGTSGTGEPAANTGLRYGPGQGEANRPLADLFPGLSGVNRLWARAIGGDTEVFISHA